ncbi:MAG: DMT family transporter [Flavobacteriales bacterium]|nr:DMT family transporter [Flavobacteriales bacterium]
MIIGDISTLYPIVRGSGIAGAVVLAIFILNEELPTTSAVGIVSVICGIAVLSYRRNRKQTSLKGILLALACGAVIMSYTLLDKLVVDKVDPFVLLLTSQFISATAFLPYVLLKRRDEMARTLRTLKLPVMGVALPALLSYLIILFVFQLADVSRVVAVRELSVVFGAISGYLLLKENFSKMRLIGVVIVVAGIILVKL